MTKDRAMNKLNDSKHPLWKFLTPLPLLAFIGLIFWLNSSAFDADEIRQWIQIAIGLYGVQTVKGWEKTTE